MLDDHTQGEHKDESAVEDERRPRRPGELPVEPDNSRSSVRRIFLTKRGRLRTRRILVGAILVLILVVLAMFLLPNKEPSRTAEVDVETTREGGKKEGEEREVALTPEALATTKIEIVEVSQRPAVALVKVTGEVEANAEKEQLVTPLVSGRVEAVHASLGQRVAAGSVLATIRSPQIAELRGQLLEARSKLALASAAVERVRKSANRAGVISTKAKLDLAEKNLDRQRRLLELGAGSLKEVQAAEAEYKTAKAEYDFQSTIAINKEIQEAESEREAARVTVERLRQSLAALGASSDQSQADSLVVVRAPISGSIIKREINPGAGVQEGAPLFTIANLATVWVTANVPESLVNRLRSGMEAEVRSTALADATRTGRITFIDPVLNEETRTARVRVDLANPGEQLKAGMFVEVGFQTGTPNADAENELVVPDEAIQRVGEHTVVFVPEEDEPGHFQVREVEVGGVVDGYRVILSGLELGDRVVARGSFALKSQLLKGQIGEDND